MDNQHRENIDKKFVACKEQHEMDFIKGELKEKYPDLTDSQIEEAMESCCKDVPPPRPRDKYMACLDEKLEITEEEEADRPTQAISKVKKNMYISMGIGLLPFPIFDMAALLGLQVKMASDISKIYDVPFSETRSKSIIVSLLGGLNAVTLSRIAFAGIVKFIPGAGAIAGAAAFSGIAGATTYAIGKVFIKHFEMGGTLLDFDLESAKKYYKEQYQEGVEEIKEAQADEAKKET